MTASLRPWWGLDWHNVLIRRGQGSGSQHSSLVADLPRSAGSNKALVHNAVLTLARTHNGDDCCQTYTVVYINILKPKNEDQTLIVFLLPKIQNMNLFPSVWETSYVQCKCYNCLLQCFCSWATLVHNIWFIQSPEPSIIAHKPYLTGDNRADSHDQPLRIYIWIYCFGQSVDTQSVCMMLKYTFPLLSYNNDPPQPSSKTHTHKGEKSLPLLACWVQIPRKLQVCSTSSMFFFVAFQTQVEGLKTSFSSKLKWSSRHA